MHLELGRRVGECFERAFRELQTPWRRTVCGDLTSAFDFANPNATLPSLPSTASYVPPDQLRHPNYVPTVPSTQAVSKQEPGVRPARALPYELFVRATNDGSNGKLTMEFVNTGKAGATFLVYAPTSSDAPRTYTVEAGKRLKDTLTVNANGAYDFSVHGPNGFYREFAGDAVRVVRFIKRAQELGGIPAEVQINPTSAFLLYFPGLLLLIPVFFHYWYVTKHQNMALRAAAGLPYDPNAAIIPSV